MSTRCNVVLKDEIATTRTIWHGVGGYVREQWYYRHCDGYPSQILPILAEAARHLQRHSDFGRTASRFQEGINLIGRGYYAFQADEYGTRISRYRHRQTRREADKPAQDRDWFVPAKPYTGPPEYVYHVTIRPDGTIAVTMEHYTVSWGKQFTLIDPQTGRILDND